MVDGIRGAAVVQLLPREVRFVSLDGWTRETFPVAPYGTTRPGTHPNKAVKPSLIQLASSRYAEPYSVTRLTRGNSAILTAFGARGYYEFVFDTCLSNALTRTAPTGATLNWGSVFRHCPPMAQTVIAREVR